MTGSPAGGTPKMTERHVKAVRRGIELCGHSASQCLEGGEYQDAKWNNDNAELLREVASWLSAQQAGTHRLVSAEEICEKCGIREKAWKAWEDAEGKEHRDRWKWCNECYSSGGRTLSIEVGQIAELDAILVRAKLTTDHPSPTREHIRTALRIIRSWSWLTPSDTDTPEQEKK